MPLGEAAGPDEGCAAKLVWALGWLLADTSPLDAAASLEIGGSLADGTGADAADPLVALAGAVWVALEASMLIGGACSQPTNENHIATSHRRSNRTTTCQSEL